VLSAAVVRRDSVAEFRTKSLRQSNIALPDAISASVFRPEWRPPAKKICEIFLVESLDRIGTCVNRIEKIGALLDFFLKLRI
jgi:hypothetical protein